MNSHRTVCARDHACALEPLEARIAPAALVRITDVDGDLVTITTSRGTNADLAQMLAPLLVEAGLGYRLDNIDFSSRPIFDGSDVTITASPQELDLTDGKSIKSGDGFVGIGYIDATSADGGTSLNLGKVTIDGDLSQIRAGKGSATAPAVKSLMVQSVGEVGYGNNNFSDFDGALGSLTVKANVRGARVEVTGDAGPITIGGSLIGTGGVGSGYIKVTGNIGAMVIKGNVIGGTGSSNAIHSGTIEAGGDIASVSIGGFISGGSAERAGSVHADGSMGNVTIKGSVLGGTGSDTGTVSADLNLGNVAIGGSLIGSSGLRNGSIFTQNAGATIGAVKIAGDVKGGSDSSSGLITTSGDITSVSIGGSLSALTAATKSVYSTNGKIGPVTIGHDVKMSAIFGTIGLGAVTIGGSILEGSVNGGLLSSVKIAGDLVGGNVLSSGTVTGSGVNSITIGGSIFGGTEVNTGLVSVSTVGSLTVGGDLIGGTVGSTGLIEALSATSIKIRGDVRGTDNVSRTGYIVATGQIKTLSIGGGLYGGDNTGTGTVEKTGSIEVDRLGSVTIGGSVIAGRNQNVSGANDILRQSGWIVAGHEIGSVVIKGSFEGDLNNHARIYARGLTGDPVANNIALKSLTIGGTVRFAWIFAGVGKLGEGISGNAQIGTVNVGGDWVDSSLSAGGDSVNGILGDGDDGIIVGGTASKIASIVIKGQVLGEAGTDNSDTSGFLSHQIGSFKYNGITVPLKSGAGNDTFSNVPSSNFAQAVGPTLAPSTGPKPDLFAVHVYEV